MSEIRTIPPILTRNEWNALLDHSLEKATSHIVRYRDGKWQAINGSTGKVDGTPDASLTTTIEYAIAQGATHIYVKGAGTWTPTNNTISGIRIEGENAANFKIYAANPDTDYLYLKPGGQLINLTVKDKSGVDQGLSPNADRKIGFCYNGRPTSNMVVSNWQYQFMVVDQGETGLDQAGIGVNMYGKGDAFWAGVESYGVGLNIWMSNAEAANINGYGITIYLWGKGMGIWADIKEGASTVGMPNAPTPTLIGLTTEMDGIMLNMYTHVPTTVDINFTNDGKTSGNMINFFHSKSDFVGNGIVLNFGHIDPDTHTGSFTGKYIDLANDNVEVFYVDSHGHPNILSKATSGTGGMLTIYNDAASACSINGLFINAGAGVGAYTGKFLLCAINAVEKFHIDADGSIAIGSTLTSGGPLISLYDTIAASTSVNAIEANFLVGSGAYTGKFLKFAVGGVEKFEVDANGSIVIDSTLASGGPLITIYDNAGVGVSANAIEANFVVGSGAYSGKFLKFEVGGLAKFEVDADGNMSITNRVTSGHLLLLYNDAASAAAFNGLTMNFGGGIGAYTGKFISCQVNSVEKFVVDYNGLVTIVNAVTSGYLVNIYSAPGVSSSANGISLNFVVGSGAYSGLFLICSVGGVVKHQIDANGHMTIASLATGGSAIGITTAGAYFLECFNSGLKFSVDGGGIVMPSGYKAADGTAGLTADVTPQNSTTVIHFKDGLFVGID